MRVRFWGTRGSIPVAMTSAEVQRKLVTALVAAAGRGLDTAGKARAFVADLFYVRLIAFLIWPTSLFLLANEGATTSVEVATNFVKAVGGNIVLYAALGALVFGVTTRSERSPPDVHMRSNITMNPTVASLRSATAGYRDR